MPTTARAVNAATVLRAVLLHGPVPRTRLAELSDLSPATVTRLYPPLAERRLLRELEGPEVGQTLGRPRVPVDLDVSGWVALGVHLGVRRSVVGALDLRGRLLGAGEVEHEDGAGAETVIGQACDRLHALHARVAGRRRVLGLGVITGGRGDAEGGRPSEQSGFDWSEKDLRAAFARRINLGSGVGPTSSGGGPESTSIAAAPTATSIPAPPIFVDEHVRAMATAESLFGRAKRARSLGYLYVGGMLTAPRRPTSLRAVAARGTASSLSRGNAGSPSGPWTSGWCPSRGSTSCSRLLGRATVRPSGCCVSGPGTSARPSLCCSAYSIRSCSSSPDAA